MAGGGLSSPRVAWPLVVAALLMGCGGDARVPEAPVARPASEGAVSEPIPVLLDPPAAEGALGPNLTVAGGFPLLSWLEEDAGEEGRHRLVVSRLLGSGWSAPVVVAEGDDFFANWADFPAVVEAGDGSLLAHWLAKTGEETYAYSIFLARSEDGGGTWSPLGPLNDDATPTEHGFVSYVAEGEGVRAFWLDGREMASGGSMALRTAWIGKEIGPAEVLDERVCECCATGAARTDDGPVVVYRDRSAAEVRDIFAVRRVADGWSEPAAVAADGWVIPGCPVNGPQIAASGALAATAWFTAAGAEPRVEAAFSRDGGASFEEPFVLDGRAPFGRVDLVMDREGGAWITWLGQSAEQEAAEVRLVRLTPEQPPAPPWVVARTSGSRSSGFPSLARVEDRLYVAWVDTGDGTARRIRVAEIALPAV